MFSDDVFVEKEAVMQQFYIPLSANLVFLDESWPLKEVH